MTRARHKLPGLWQSQTALPLVGQYHHQRPMTISGTLAPAAHMHRIMSTCNANQMTRARHKLPGLWQSQTALPLVGQYHHQKPTMTISATLAPAAHMHRIMMSTCNANQMTRARHKLPGLWQSQTALPLVGQYHHQKLTMTISGTLAPAAHMHRIMMSTCNVNQMTRARHKLPGLWQSQTALPLVGQYHYQRPTVDDPLG